VCIFGDATGDPIADRVLEVLRVNPEGLSRSDLHSYFGRNISASRLGRALDLLLQSKKATFKIVETGGRSKEVWTPL
jgi:hypothetical protein